MVSLRQDIEPLRQRGQKARVLVLTRYDRMGASSRLRFLQFLPALKAAGDARFEFHVAPLLPDAYLENLYGTGRRKMSQVTRAYFRRLRELADARSFDLIWLEKEFLPYAPAWLERWLAPRHTPIIVDYDDAIFHQYQSHSSPFVRWALGNKIDRICAAAHTVIVGNEFLAAQARKAGAARVVVIPTIIDTKRYPALEKNAAGDMFRIGWIGTPVTAKYLEAIQPALARLTSTFDACLNTIGAPDLALPGVRHVAAPWSEGNEARMLSNCDAAVAPLDNGAWERGKCGYSIIQCMAAGLPVVTSPVGVAASIVDHGVNGFLASDEREYEQILLQLKRDDRARRQIGQAARETVRRRFSAEVWNDRLQETLVSALQNNGTSGRFNPREAA